MKKLLIGKDCSPARMVSHKEMNVQKVLVTFGGGMGGANKTYYCESIVRNPEFYDLKLISGELKQVNPTYIVEIGSAKLVKVVVDVTGHSHFNSIGAKKCTRTMITELLYGQEYEVVETTNSSRNDQVILDEVDFK